MECCQPSGDQLTLRSSRLSQSSRTSSASCIHVPGPFTWAGSSSVNKPGKPLGEVDALPEHDLAPAGGAERGLEHAEQREERPRGLLLEARRVVRARRLEVRVEPRLVRPRAVFHVEDGLVFATVGRDGREVDVVHR